MKVCCFGKQPDSRDVSEVIDSVEPNSDSPTSHLAETGFFSKKVAVDLADCTLKVEGKLLKVHTQVSREIALPLSTFRSLVMPINKEEKGF